MEIWFYKFSSIWKKNPSKTLKAYHLAIQVEEKPRFRKAFGYITIFTGIILAVAGFAINCPECSNGTKNLIRVAGLSFAGASYFGGKYIIDDAEKRSIEHEIFEKETLEKLSVSKEDCKKIIQPK